MSGTPSAPFDFLSPDLALEAVEEATGLRLDGSVSNYPSYINRVYGFRSEEGAPLVAKFYRPGRWRRDAILEEHAFVADCAKAEIPVVAPLLLGDGSTLGTLELDAEEAAYAFEFAVYPKRGGRNFDAESEGDWRRLGSLVGRLHRVGTRTAPSGRPRLDSDLVAAWIEELRPLIHPDARMDFELAVGGCLEWVGPRLDSIKPIRIHGDLHRGNILERPGEGLLLIDFDDCMLGPPVQDLWLLLPGRTRECGLELEWLLEGYSDFAKLETGSVALIEGLRFLRMLHFLAWRARQRNDAWFAREFPDWGTKGYWMQEVAALEEQAFQVTEASPY